MAARGRACIYQVLTPVHGKIIGLSDDQRVVYLVAFTETFIERRGSGLWTHSGNRAVIVF